MLKDLRCSVRFKKDAHRLEIQGGRFALQPHNMGLKPGGGASAPSLLAAFDTSISLPVRRRLEGMMIEASLSWRARFFHGFWYDLIPELPQGEGYSASSAKLWGGVNSTTAMPGGRAWSTGVTLINSLDEPPLPPPRQKTVRSRTSIERMADTLTTNLCNLLTKYISP